MQSVLLYSSETWAITVEYDNQLEIFEIFLVHLQSTSVYVWMSTAWYWYLAGGRS